VIRTEAGVEETITLGGGCFWCLQPLFQELRGVSKVEVGYSGGGVKNPTYEAVCTDTTGHAEVVDVTFDPKAIPLGDLLRVFFTVHDPTTPNRQGNAEGDREACDPRVRRRQTVGRPDCHGGRAVFRVLSGRRVPPGLLREEPIRGVLSRGHRAEGREVPETVPRTLEEVRPWPRLRSVWRGPYRSA